MSNKHAYAMSYRNKVISRLKQEEERLFTELCDCINKDNREEAYFIVNLYHPSMIEMVVDRLGDIYPIERLIIFIKKLKFETDLDIQN